MRNAIHVVVGSIWFGDFHRTGRWRRTCSTRPIFCKYVMKTATPPKGVTARWVSRRITRSPESRAVISCGTNLSEVFTSTPLYRKHLRAKYSSVSEFRLIIVDSYEALPRVHTRVG